MTTESHRPKSQKIDVKGNISGSNLVLGDWNRVFVININQRIKDDASNEPISSSNKSNSNPYKGLASFQKCDSKLYFGREALIEDLWKSFQTLYRNSFYIDNTTRFLTILGPSGCGKSSLVMAGLVPAFERKPLLDKDSIRAVILRPGEKPVRSLSSAIFQLEREYKNVNDSSIDQYISRFKDLAKKEIYEVLDEIASSFKDIEACPILIIIDQFEQIYSHCNDDNERKTFIENLIYAARQKSGHVSVIATLRSDFFESAQNSQLSEVIVAKNLFTVRSMTDDELYLAITKPAEATKYPLDSGIIGHLVKDATGKKGILPLLQFTLKKIWDGLSNGIDPIETYYGIGGIGGALAMQAQEIYDGLPTEKEKNIVQRVFLNLIQTREGVPDTGRSVILNNLITKTDSLGEIRKVVQLFASPSVRLLTLDIDIDKNYETVEVTHEALFTNWQQLEEWLRDNREFIDWHEQLRAAIQQWVSNQEDEYSLLQGKALEEAEKQLKEYSIQLSTQECRYIQMSLDLRHKRLQKEANQKYRNIGALSTIFFLIVCGIFIYIFRSIFFQNELESVLLEADNTTPRIEQKLPRLLEKAHKFRARSDTFRYQNNHNEAIIFYTDNKEDIDKLMDFYKRIIEISNTIKMKSEKGDYIDKTISANSEIDEVMEAAEISLSEVVYKYRIPELKVYLNRSNFGKYQGGSGPPAERFTEGALRTTYQIIVNDAGGDINLNGEMENLIEANHIPCQVLSDIEEAWLSSSKRIGWKASEPENFESESLSFLVFDSAGPFIDSRIKNCRASA